MGANKRSSLDPRWTKHQVPVVVGFMLAEIRVIRKDPTIPLEYDQNTKTYVGGFETVFEGKARIQPYGIIGDMNVAQDTTGRRLMRVQIREKTAGIQLDDMIEVISCPDDAELVNYVLEVRGSIGESNSWVRDIVTEANLKWG